jgi:hypothetical protein
MHCAARLFSAAAIGASLLTAGCTSATTSVAAPSAPAKCQITATIQPSSFSHSGGRGTIAVRAARECAWSVASSASWIAIAGAGTGQGDAVVDYSVSENPAPSGRSATVAVEEVRLAVSQAAAPCTYQLDPGDETIGAGGGTVGFRVATLSGCTWTAASRASWISVTAGSSGSASGTVQLRVDANSGPFREGSVSLADRAFVVRQAAFASPAPAPPPAPPPPPETEVRFDGVIASIAGLCPFVSFIASGRAVVTDGDTDYRGGRCRDLSVGDEVSVRGRTLPGGAVRATRIEFEDEDDDDD